MRDIARPLKGAEVLSMRELLFFRPREALVPTSTIVAHYQDLSPAGNKDFAELFKTVNVWYDTVFTESLAKNAHVFYSPEIPHDHPDHLLTSYGEKQNLIAVARSYLDLQRNGKLPEHLYIRNLQYFIGQLKSGVTPPNTIVVTGRIRQKLYIIDGNTRSIAAAIVWLENGGHFPPLKTYIGRPGLFSRFSISQFGWR
jgi:hypothetical protein